MEEIQVEGNEEKLHSQLQGGSIAIGLPFDMLLNPVVYERVGEPGVDPGEIATSTTQAPRHHADQHTLVHYRTTTVSLK